MIETLRISAGNAGRSMPTELHAILYDADMKFVMFGYFCALELYGTLKLEDCPPINGRMAEALRYLGYDVRGA